MLRLGTLAALTLHSTSASAQGPGSGLVPLGVGNTWRYSTYEHVGGGPRFLLFFGDRGSTTKTGTWSFKITGAAGERYTAELTKTPVEGLPTVTKMTLWERDGVVWMDAGTGEREAVAAVLPPTPVSSEKIRCVSALLGGVAGTCAPLYGGPLGVPPGLTDGLITSNEQPSAVLGQFLVGIVTAGIFIPGNRSTRHTLTLDEFIPGPGQAALFAPQASAILRQIQRGQTSNAQMKAAVRKNPTDIEGIAAGLQILSPSQIDSTLQAVLPLLPILSRYPVLRAAILRSDRPLRTLARARFSVDTSIPEREQAALMPLFERDQETVRTILDGDSPLLTAVVADTHTEDDQERTNALKRQLPHHPPSLKEGRLVLGLYSFDEPRHEGLNLLLTSLPEPRHADAIAAWLPVFTFDEHRLKVLEEHRSLLRSLPVSARESLVSSLSFSTKEGRILLLAPEDVWIDVRRDSDGSPSLFAVLESSNSNSSFDSDLLKQLQTEAPRHEITTPVLSAVLGLFAFDEDRLHAALLLLGHVDRAHWLDSVLAAEQSMSFDDGRLALLQALRGELPAVPAADRRRLIEPFVFEEAEASALLGI